MSLITEDGTGLANAESLCSVATADAYHLSIGNNDWLFLAEMVKEQCLRKATAYMAKYRSKYTGLRKTTAQALDFPRTHMPIKDALAVAYYDDASIPADVQNACASLAFRASSATLLADQKRSKLRVSIGPISTEYDPYSPISSQYKEIDAMLAPYLVGGGIGGLQMVRI